MILKVLIIFWSKIKFI